ncbi:MAG TPA: hypothetical protein VIL49_03890 [Capillimicrobium sp.]
MRPSRLPLAVAAALVAGLSPAAVHGQATTTTERIETLANVLTPSDVGARANGEILAVDTSGGRLVRVDPATGAVTEVASGFTRPRGLSPLPDGGALVADTGANRVRRVLPNGTTVVVAGPVSDDVPAAASPLSAPGGVAALPDGGFLVADTGNHRFVRVTQQGELTTVAGVAKPGFSGDGGQATAAQLSSPARVAALVGGGFLIADTGNNRIRRVGTDGRITTIAGQLSRPEGVAVRPSGAVLIADTGLNLIRELGVDGSLRTVAGQAQAGFAGDGGPAADAFLSAPRSVTASGDRIVVADTGNGRLRAIAAVQDDPDPVTPDPVIDDETPEPPPGVAPPVLGRRAVASAARGTVLVRLPGRRRFAPLDEAANLPLGTELDARRGTAAVFFITDRGGRVALALASGGRFTLRQPDRLDRGQRPGVLRLSERLHGCAPAPRGGAAAVEPLARAAAKKGKRKRRLRVRAEGRIQTTGRYGSAIVRGTAWTITDRCGGPRAGTLVAVSDGVVAVTDLVRDRTVRVPAGERFLARAPRR